MSTNINASNASNASPFPPPKSAIYTRTGDKGIIIKLSCENYCFIT